MTNYGAVLSDLVFELRDLVLPSDREAVRGLIDATGFFRPDEVEVAVELVDERLTRGLESGYRFAFAEIDGKLAGYTCYGPIACTTASYDLYWIAVVPRWQRCGLGRRLMQATEQRIAAAGGDRVYVDTSGKPQYEPTRRFYEQSGYQVAARLAEFYSPGDDRVIYAKIIGKPS